MTLNYLNMNALLARLIEHQQHIERYIGFKQVVDAVYKQPQNITHAASLSQRKMNVLLTAQQDVAQNGLYYIDVMGTWKPLLGSIEQGNLVAHRIAQQDNQYDYYQLQCLNGNQQIWQRFSLSDLHS